MIGWSARKEFHMSHISTVEKKCAVCFQEGNLWKRPLSLSLQPHAFHFGKERNYLMAEFRRRHRACSINKIPLSLFRSASLQGSEWSRPSLIIPEGKIWSWLAGSSTRCLSNSYRMSKEASLADEPHDILYSAHQKSGWGERKSLWSL